MPFVSTDEVQTHLKDFDTILNKYIWRFLGGLGIFKI